MKGLVSATSVFNGSDKIYLFGGESDEIDLTGPELNYVEYDLSKDTYAFKIHFGIRSPYLNSRTLTPGIVYL